METGECVYLGSRGANAIIVAMGPHSKSILFVFLAGITGLLSACGADDIAPSTSAWTPIPPTTQIVLATPTPASAQAVRVVDNGFCVDDALFLEDLTIPDQTVVIPGETLDKRWSVQNSGSCDWGPGYRLSRIGNDSFGVVGELALYPARAGSMAVWQVILSAPPQPGEHISIWQASSPDGAQFGEQVFLWVLVPTPAPVPTSRGTPTN
jgi:hypothetical protein